MAEAKKDKGNAFVGQIKRQIERLQKLQKARGFDLSQEIAYYQTQANDTNAPQFARDAAEKRVKVLEDRKATKSGRYRDHVVPMLAALAEVSKLLDEHAKGYPAPTPNTGKKATKKAKKTKE